MNLTFDTNVPARELKQQALDRGHRVWVISVTARETEGTSWAAEVSALQVCLEASVWDESCWDEAEWGDDGDDLERALQIISHGSFPKKADRSHLTKSQARQLRDAMILCAHVRHRGDVLVTDDAKAFGGQNRELLEREFPTKIMKGAEFVAFLRHSSDDAPV